MKNQKQKKQEYSQNNIIQFDRVKRTKSGWALFVGKNVIFLNDGLLNFISKQKGKAS